MDALATSKTNADLQNPTKIETLLKSRAIQEVQDRSSVRVNPISVAEDIKRRWKATMTQVADKQRQQTALGYRWNLTAEERDGRAKERQRSMRSLKKPSICGTVEPAERLSSQRHRAASVTASVASSAGLDEVARIIQTSIDLAIAPGTLKIYQRVKLQFLAFISKFKVPISEIAKLRNIFIAHLIHIGKDRSLGYYVSALSHFFGILAEDDADVLKALIRASNKTKPMVRHRTKASKQDVQTVISVAMLANSDQAVIGATMVLLAFSGLLRVSELCGLQFQHFSYKGDGIWWILIARSKTDQNGEGTQVAVKWGLEETLLWQRFCKLRRPLWPSSFLFAPTNGRKPTRDLLARKMRKVLHMSALGHKNLTPHSFRGEQQLMRLEEVWTRVKL